MVQTFNNVIQNTFGGTVAFNSNDNSQSWNGTASYYDVNIKKLHLLVNNLWQIKREKC